jgi:hypothetical protein
MTPMLWIVLVCVVIQFMWAMMFLSITIILGIARSDFKSAVICALVAVVLSVTSVYILTILKPIMNGS